MTYLTHRLLTINTNVCYDVSNREELIDRIQANGQPDAEIWLEQNGDPDGELPRLCALKNGPLYCLQYMTTRSAARRFYSYKAQLTGTIERVRFRLANGDQYDTYSTNCVDVDSAYAVMIEFLESHGGRSVAIDWQKE